jgi:hypothetical protein
MLDLDGIVNEFQYNCCERQARTCDLTYHCSNLSLFTILIILLEDSLCYNARWEKGILHFFWFISFSKLTDSFDSFSFQTAPIHNTPFYGLLCLHLSLCLSVSLSLCLSVSLSLCLSVSLSLSLSLLISLCLSLRETLSLIDEPCAHPSERERE